MSNEFVIALEKPVGEAGGGNYPRVFHAYKGVLGKVYSKTGWIKLPFIGADVTTASKAGIDATIDVKSTAKNLSTVGLRWAAAVAASNPALVEAGMLDATAVDLTKFDGKLVGVVYEPDTAWNKTSEQYEETGYSSIGRLIPIDDVDTWTVDTKVYEETEARLKAIRDTAKGGTTPSTTTITKEPAKTAVQPIVDDGMDLPF